MPNLLAIPFKKSYSINLKDPVRSYISTHGGAHPDEFKMDIKIWQDLRRDGTGGVVHVNRVDAALLYHAQLVSVLAKLPTDIQLEVAYAPVFEPSGIPITMKNLVFERASILFNLAALYSQLAAGEDRSTPEGIKRAAVNYQNAAGSFSFMISTVIPKLVYSSDDETVVLDLSEPFLKSLEWLMLAQAQECSWQLARLNQYKNSLIARIAARVSVLYRSCATVIREASPPIKHIIPFDWLAHIEAKSHHFAAVSEFRKSMDEIEASRYGVELARLGQAQISVKRAFDTARRGGITATVLQDISSLRENVEKNLVRAERDNDLIYHQDVPTTSALPPIQEANLVNSTVPAGLVNPASVIGTRPLLFEGLIGWGAREAISIYEDRKDSLIKEQIIQFAQAMQDQADEELRKLNLPSALEALERPIGLPPSLLRKAEEVRLEDGPAKIEASIEDVQRLAQHDLSILDEAMDILDNEASEDESARKRTNLNRAPSHEANMELIEKEKRYRSILQQAAASDETIRQKWDDWEDNIVELTQDEPDLEASVPSSTVSPSSQSSPEGRQTREHARALRVQLEQLDSLHRDRDQLVKRARMLADADDIQPLITQAASGFERLAEVEPSMFEDISDEQLAKYDKFIRDILEIEQKENNILAEIKTRNENFLNSRRDDPSVKAREHALQSLDLAYFKYKEIIRNLEEGFKFYNDLAGILMQFKEVCKAWSSQRIQEIHSVSRNTAAQSQGQNDIISQEGNPSHLQLFSSITPRKPLAGKSALGLPSLNSSEWGFEEIELPPGPKDKK